MAHPEGYNNLSRREVAAMLVHCTYFRDLHSSKVRHLTWPVAKLMGYQNSRAEHYGKEFWTPLKSKYMPTSATKLKELRVAFYVRQQHHPGPAPHLVIALRGTLPYLRRDLKDDIRISGEVLLEGERVRECLVLIENVVREFRSVGDICLAGHSLGAGIALLVAKHLALSGTAIDTHLFAPPLLSLASIAKGLLTTMSSTADERLPSEATDERQLFYTKLTERMQEGGVGVVGVPEEERHSGVGLMGNAIVETVGKKDLDQEWQEFQKLLDWVPQFYLNRDDIICNQYIKYYEKRTKMEVAATRRNIDISEQAIISRFFGKNAKYITNVVPSASLYISHKYQGRPLKAHSLKQWHRFTDAHIKVEESQPRLLAGFKHHTLERTTRYAGNKLHGLGKSVVAKVARPWTIMVTMHLVHSGSLIDHCSSDYLMYIIHHAIIHFLNQGPLYSIRKVVY